MSYRYGNFVWFEAVTENPEKTKAFYSEVMNWKMVKSDMPGMDYDMIVVGEDHIGGVMKPQAPNTPPHWLSYISVEDVDATAKKIVAAGGKTLIDAFDVAQVGRMQPVADPQGGVFCIYHGLKEDNPQTTGPGTWHWSELYTSDVDAAKTFYQAAFGFEIDEMEMEKGDTYCMFRNPGAEAPSAGLLQRPSDDIPTNWLPYFQVESCDDTVARTKTHGGSVGMDAMDAPGVGRFAILMDPMGAGFGVITPAKS